MNQKPFRTLFIWVIWIATALGIYLSLYQGSEIWDFVARDTSRITWLILGMFGVSVVGSFALTLMITFESTEALRMEYLLREKGIAGIEIKSLRRAVQRFFNSIKSIIASNATADVEALLHTELGVYQRISHTVDVIGNLLITFGLIGTVMGLSLTLTGLSSSLQALGSDQELLLSGLRKAMGGMETAFYITLLGIVLGGVLLRMCSQITQHGVESLHDWLTRMVLVYCARDMQPSLERDLRSLDAELQALGQHVGFLENMLNNSRTALSQFREETVNLKQDIREERDLLVEDIRRHIHYSKLLRSELKMMRRINNPWWKKWRRRRRPSASEKETGQ